MRRQLLTGLIMTIALTVLLGSAVSARRLRRQPGSCSSDKANGSFVKNKDGQVVGSSLIGQNFVDTDGNPDPKYFQPRPSAAGDGYDALASGGTNLGRRTRSSSHRRQGRTAAWSTRSDADGNPVLGPDGNPEQECYGDTVPARATYREFNELAADAEVPVDAVTASASGLDPHISVANAELQAPRVADAPRPAGRHGATR